MEATAAFQHLFVKYAQMEGSDMTVKDAVQVGDRTLREAEVGKAYLRLDWNIVTGRKPGGSQEGPESNGA
jgi:hypothetical protein